MDEPLHLRPTAELAERVIVPGDPGRALVLAQLLLEEPRMFNHHRGLWGYTGTASDGEPMSIQSTGMGGPSAAIVLSELAGLGARRLLRVGTCGAIAGDHDLGDLILARDCLAGDGTSRALGAGEVTVPDDGLLGRLRAAAKAGGGAVASVRAVTTDLFYDPRPGIEDGWIAAGAEVVEMETATLFTLAAARGLCAASVLIVSDLVRPERVRIEPAALAAAEARAGRIAAVALGAG